MSKKHKAILKSLTFSKLKKKAEADYKKIRKITCPAFKDEILFSSDGFHHLRYDNCRKERSKQVQRNKFKFLQDSVRVLKQTTTVQEYRNSICPVGKRNKSGLRKTKTVEWFAFFAIIDFDKKIRIKVIVKRIGGKNGKYHFWSIIPYWKLSGKRNVIGAKEIEDR